MDPGKCKRILVLEKLSHPNRSNPVWTSREAPHQRPDAELQDSGAARGQRVRRRGAQVRAHTAADHGRGESEPRL